MRLSTLLEYHRTLPPFSVSKSRDDGKLHVAWSKPGTVRAVTTALLKSEFGFDVEPPVDRLTPPVSVMAG